MRGIRDRGWPRPGPGGPGARGGTELAAAARRLRPGLPTVLTTGCVGAVRIEPPPLLKPFRAEDPDAAITRALAQG